MGTANLAISAQCGQVQELQIKLQASMRKQDLAAALVEGNLGRSRRRCCSAA